MRLCVDGKPLPRPLVVKMDPRVKATAAEIKIQYDISRAIDASLRRSATALRDAWKATTAAVDAAIAEWEKKKAGLRSPGLRRETS